MNPPAPYVMPIIVDANLRVLMGYDPDGMVPLRAMLQEEDKGDNEPAILRVFKAIQLHPIKPMTYLHSGVFRGAWHTAYVCLLHHRDTPFEADKKRVVEYRPLSDLNELLPDKVISVDEAFLSAIKTKLVSHVVNLARDRASQR